MQWQTRLRLIAGTFLVTSLLWAGGLAYWWNAPAPQSTLVPAGISALPVSASAQTITQAAPPNGQTKVTYKPEAPVTAPAAMPNLIIPVQGVAANQLTDTFTQAREGGLRVHDAIDIMAPRGTPVLAAAAGTIERLYTSAAGGLTIYLRLDDRRFIHYYAHLDSYASGLTEGQRVKQGQVIGAVGYTGNANAAAPHLHFAIQLTTEAAKWYEPSTALNPYPMLTRR
jgi:murein DD-endopeptidase MepM/ murein hydrolase activator NlpD